MLYAIIEMGGRNYTFLTEGNKVIGQPVICKTRKGDKLGVIAELKESCDFMPTAMAVKIDAGNRRKLSAYDAAKLTLLEGGTVEEALANFSGYGDEKAIAAFLYNETLVTRVSFANNFGTKVVKGYGDAYDQNDVWYETILVNYNFG